MAQPQPAVTETNLIEQAQNGDRNAFGELVRSHYQGVVLVVYLVVSARPAADENTASVVMAIKAIEVASTI